MNLFYVLLLGFAVSIDGFVAGIAYGIKNISIPSISLCIVGITTTLCTGGAMAAACILGAFLNTRLAILIGAVLLTLIGLFSLYQEYIIANFHSSTENQTKVTHYVTFSVGCLVNVMAEPEIADIDHSKLISPLEAILLGLALGIDNMIATFAAALVSPLPLYTPITMGCIQVFVIASGIYTSRHFISDHFKNRIPYLPGLILILLGLIRLW